MNADSGLTLDDSQGRVVEFEGPVLKALGAAGSGKTTALVTRATHLVEAHGAEPSGVLIFVHDRRAAVRLRNRLVRSLGASVAGPSIFTFHGWCWSLLTRVYPVASEQGITAEVGYELAGYGEEPVLLTAFDQRAFVIRLLSEEDPAAWPVNGALLSSKAFAGEVRDFLLRAQERLQTPGDVHALSGRRGRDDWLELASFYERYLRRLEDPGSFGDGRPRFDFARVLTEARRLIGEHESVQGDLKNLYPHVLVDDFEEGNRAQMALLETMLPEAGDGRSAVITGDPDGSVSAFRGADPGVLSQLPAQQVVLEQHYRRSEPPRILLYSQPTEEARGIVAELRTAGATQVAWGEMAVIVRDLRSVLGPLRRELNRSGVPHRVDGEALRLASDPVVRPILVLFSIACRRQGHEELWPELLTSELGGFAAHELVQLRRAARLAGESLDRVCADVRAIDVPESLRDKLQAVCSLVADACGWASGLPPDECFWRLWDSATWFAEMVKAEDDRRLDSLTTLADALGRFTERQGSDARLADFIDTLLSADFAPESVRLDRAQDAVSIITAHASKGREYEFTVVAGCVEGTWPDPARRGLLLELDLLDGPKSQAHRQRVALAEEQRLFELATSRGRRLVLTGQRSGGSERSSAEPSRFLKLLVPALPEQNADVPELVNSAREAEISWRRRVAYGAASPAERLAVVWGLTRLPEADPRRWWWGRRWTHNDTPALIEKKTSYSRFATYEDCPLKYLMGQVLGLDPVQTYQMAYGSLVHGLLEDLEKGELPRDLDALLAEAERRWRPEAYPPGAVSAWLRRDVRAILERYLEFEANNGHTTIAVESWFEFDIGDWLVRGKIDRIDQVHGNGLRLCDYKTSNSYKFESAVKDDLQLMTYFLACMRSDELRALGTPKIAELIYLRHEKEGSIRRAAINRPKDAEDGTRWDDVVEGRIAELIRGIEEEDFAPNPDAECRFCSFKPLCPMWPQGEELRVS